MCRLSSLAAVCLAGLSLASTSASAPYKPPGWPVISGINFEVRVCAAAR